MDRRKRDKILACIQAEQEVQSMKRRGQKTVPLTVDDKLLLTLTYLRHDPTFAQVGHQFGICESYAHKVYQSYLDRLVKVCHVPGRKALLDADLMAILVDVTEQPLERPTRHHGSWYAEKKRQTFKPQRIVCLFSLQIVVVGCGKGRTHDFDLLKQAQLRIAPAIEQDDDAGDQGLGKCFAKEMAPGKKPKTRSLTPDEKA